MSLEIEGFKYAVIIELQIQVFFSNHILAMAL